MKKLKYEGGHLVLRNEDGTLFWKSHWVEMKGSYADEYLEGGYKEIWIEGELTEKSDYYPDKKLKL